MVERVGQGVLPVTACIPGCGGHTFQDGYQAQVRPLSDVCFVCWLSFSPLTVDTRNGVLKSNWLGNLL